MHQDAKRKRTKGVGQRKGRYILCGAAIGFSVPLILLLLLQLLIPQSPELMLFEILVLSLGDSAIESILFIIAAVTVLGGLIGYWVWQAKVEREKSHGESRK